MFMDSLLIMELKKISPILDMLVSRVMTFRSKGFEKYEICDGLNNYLLCVIKSKKLKVHHISKGMFFITNIK